MFSIAKAHRGFDQGRQNDIEIERRTADNL